MNNPPPRFVEISRNEGNMTLRWRAIAGKTYRLLYNDSLLAPNGWIALNTFTATNSIQTAVEAAAGSQQRFYRIEESP